MTSNAQTRTEAIKSRIDKSRAKLAKVSPGGHLGGTHFGQVVGDAGTKRRSGGKSRPNAGRN